MNLFKKGYLLQLFPLKIPDNPEFLVNRNLRLNSLVERPNLVLVARGVVPPREPALINDVSPVDPVIGQGDAGKDRAREQVQGVQVGAVVSGLRE